MRLFHSDQGTIPAATVLMLMPCTSREDSIVDRRSFLATLIGGLAAASFASAGLAAQPQVVLAVPAGDSGTRPAQYSD